MMSAQFEVTFRVIAETKLGEVVCVVGNCPELGDWKPHNAKQLKMERKTGNRYVRRDGQKICKVVALWATSFENW